MILTSAPTIARAAENISSAAKFAEKKPMKFSSMRSAEMCFAWIALFQSKVQSFTLTLFPSLMRSSEASVQSIGKAVLSPHTAAFPTIFSRMFP